MLHNKAKEYFFLSFLLGCLANYIDHYHLPLDFGFMIGSGIVLAIVGAFFGVIIYSIVQLLQKKMRAPTDVILDNFKKSSPKADFWTGVGLFAVFFNVMFTLLITMDKLFTFS